MMGDAILRVRNLAQKLNLEIVNKVWNISSGYLIAATIVRGHPRPIERMARDIEI